QVGLARSRPEKRVSAHVARPPAQVRAVEIESRDVPELLCSLVGRERTDPRRVRLVTKRIEARGVAELGDVDRRAVRERQNSAKLPAAGNLAGDAMVSKALAGSEGQFVDIRGYEAPRYVELRQPAHRPQVIAVS